MSPPRDASSSVAWPPIIFATAFALALLASSQSPLHIATEASRTLIYSVGIIMIIVSGSLVLAAEWSFLKAGTATLPTRTTTTVVPTGIYRFTRNPMYLGMSIMLFGAGLFSNSWWFLAALPSAIIAVTKLAIKREEAYLERKFGSQYLDYKAQTRRWL